MRAAKNAVRAAVRWNIAAMTPQEKSRQSEVVAAKVLSLPQYHNSRWVSVYLSMDDEVSTAAIVKDIFRSGKTCFIPRYFEDGSRRMDMVLLKDEDELGRLPLTKWGIRQPPESQNAEDALLTGGLDLVLVPGVAFTLDGLRLGRGKGFYDAYLQRCRSTPSTSAPPCVVALAFSQQLVEHLPADELDQTMDIVVHPD